MHQSFLTGALCALALTFTAQAQEVSEVVKVDVKDIKVAEQKTPQLQITNVTDKRWKPKNWLEVDVALEAKKARQPGDKNPFIDTMEFKYFVALNKQDATGKYILLTATINHLNVVSGEVTHSMAFASPAALSRLLEKPDFSNADVKAAGVEIYFDGKLAGWKSSLGARWWEKLDGFTATDGVLLPKAKTPFSTLWGDYDLESKQ
jgi:hypothetical protein